MASLSPNKNRLCVHINAKKALIIVPHEDDEILVAGNLICHLIQNNVVVYIVFATNGDWMVPAEKRIKEAIKSSSVLGIPEEQIIFLGYGDSLNSENKRHLYYYDKGATTSPSGHRETYGAFTKQDYSYARNGTHHAYNRTNFEIDLHDVITDLYPDIIVCCDFDEHSDHRALSICFGNVINRILKETESYRPLVLKRFAYCLAYFAEADYYQVNCLATKRPAKGHIDKYDYDIIDSFLYSWETRIRIPTMEFSDKIYRAMSKHKSQHLISRAERILNSDEVYWAYPTNNLALTAEISSSSGTLKYLNDGQYYLVEDIDRRIPRFSESAWIPDKSDERPYIKCKWKQKHKIKKVRIFPAFSEQDIRCNLAIYTDNEKALTISSLPRRGRYRECILSEDRLCQEITIVFDFLEQTFSGIAEIEVFQDDEKDGFIEPYVLPIINQCVTTEYYSDSKTREYNLCSYVYGNATRIERKVVSGRATFDEDKLIVDDSEKQIEVEITAFINNERFSQQACIKRIGEYRLRCMKMLFIGKYSAMLLSKLLHRCDVYGRYFKTHSLRNSVKWMIGKVVR